ncbi:3-keto-5-aminohexanoate cleavage protein [Desulfoluna butyratoxydans]|uniref:3-keto-5-aminohexanoate cleavage enzyme n=1 Tax=Desulfoluna butyratoxydans TaxID=231438 RepID=A0A4U8YTL8_9BACT|nr:3-keto-5-aminohexanoate cleavage protein [Desulfoluna butyratoxydans]VFQ47204.1 3-keto-5-aminohexanoate cleavage enzyme [Desulfoluna butyratoxydans]
MSNTPLIISAAIVGAELTRDTYPNLPLTPDEIAEAAEEAVNAGASIIHLHVRDENGLPTQRVDVFETVTEKIRNRCDCILQYSTGGAVGTPVELRCNPVSLKPDMATLSMGTMNFGSEIYENTEETITTIARAITDNDVMAELEVFDFGQLETVMRMVKKGLVPERHHMDFVLGVPGGMAATISNLVMLVNRLQEGQTWAVAGLGRGQLPMAMHSIAMGGHVRVGIEDNIYYRKGELAVSNAQLVERVVRIAREYDRPAATVDQARQILGLSE